jgi:hypothetical protein
MVIEILVAGVLMVVKFKYGREDTSAVFRRPLIEGLGVTILRGAVLRWSVLTRERAGRGSTEASQKGKVWT